MLTLGQKMHLIRKRKGLTLADLAQGVGSTTGYMSSLERDKVANPSVTMLRKVADALNVSMSYLLDDGIEAEIGDKSLAALINAISPLDADKRACVAKFVAAITD